MAFHWNQVSSHGFPQQKWVLFPHFLMVLMLVTSTSFLLVFSETYHHHSRRNEVSDRRQLKKKRNSRNKLSKKDNTKKCIEFFHDSTVKVFTAPDEVYIASGTIQTADTNSPWTFDKISFVLKRVEEFTKEINGESIKFYRTIGTYLFTVEENTSVYGRSMFTLNCELEEWHLTGTPQPTDPTELVVIGNCGLSAGTGIFAGATGEWYFDVKAAPPFFVEGQAIICLA